MNTENARKRVLLDVRGKIFSASTDSLIAVDCYFSRLIAENFCQDPNGCIFIDRNPKHFKHILSMLSNISDQWTLPSTDSGCQELLAEVDFYQLPQDFVTKLAEKVKQREKTTETHIKTLQTQLDEASEKIATLQQENMELDQQAKQYKQELVEGSIRNGLYISLDSKKLCALRINSQTILFSPEGRHDPSSMKSGVTLFKVVYVCPNTSYLSCDGYKVEKVDGVDTRVLSHMEVVVIDKDEILVLISNSNSTTPLTRIIMKFSHC